MDLFIHEHSKPSNSDKAAHDSDRFMKFEIAHSGEVQKKKNEDEGEQQFETKV